MGRESRGGPAGSFAQSLSQMALKALTEAAVIPKLHWEGFAFRITRVATCRIQFFMDCWLEDFSSCVVVGWKSASIPCHVGLSKPPLTVWQLTSSEWASEESQREHASKMDVTDLRRDIPSLLMLSVMSKSLAQCTFEGRNYTRTRIAGGGRHRRVYHIAKHLDQLLKLTRSRLEQNWEFVIMQLMKKGWRFIRWKAITSRSGIVKFWCFVW